jgi:hypothetical protein
MSEALTADGTAELLLWYYEEPGRYRAEGRRRDAPVIDPTVVLKLALGRHVDFVKASLAEPRTISTLQDAAGLYVRLVFFRHDATPYQVLGLPPSASREAIRESFRLLMHLVHPDRQDARAIWPDSFAALVNRAYGILRNQDARTRFDRDAEARAAMARAVNRSATAHEASRMPVPVPRQRRRRGPLDGVVLPEWLTAGVGGFAREHPSVTAFAALIGTALVVVAFMVWEGPDGALTRDVDSASEPIGATSIVHVPKLAWFKAATGAAPVAADESASPKRSRPPDDAKVANVEVKPSARTAPVVGPIIAADADSPAATTATARSDPPASALRPVSTVEPTPMVAAVAASSAPSALAATTIAHVEAPTTVMTSAVSGSTTATTTPVSASAPATSEIESLFATFVDSYERGRVDVFADLFDVDAEANLRQGRPAIRGEYDELFRLSQWRKMQLTRVNWKRVDNRAFAKGEITVRIGWRDGREVEQRLALDMELVRRDGRVVIARLSQQARN